MMNSLSVSVEGTARLVDNPDMNPLCEAAMQHNLRSSAQLTYKVQLQNSFAWCAVSEPDVSTMDSMMFFFCGTDDLTCGASCFVVYFY